MTPLTLAAIRILALVAAYRERFGERAAQCLAIKCVRVAHRFTDRLCGVQGCDNVRAGAHPYCKKHQMRYARHGDPTIVCRPGRKKRG